MNTDDKLRDTLQEWLLSERQYRAGADLIRSRFVVIDRNNLPEVTVSPVYGDLRSGPTACLPERTGDVRRWALGYLAIAEYVDSNPPVVVDEKAVESLADELRSMGGVVAPRGTAVALIRAGWKRGVTP